MGVMTSFWSSTTPVEQNSGQDSWVPLEETKGGEWYGLGVTVDSSDNIYVTGKIGAGMDGNTHGGFDDSFLVKYNSSGTKQWTRQLGTNGYDNGFGVTVDSSDNIYVTGNTQGGLDGNTNSGGYDIFLVKYNSSGTKQWTKQLGTSSVDEGNGVTVDSSDNIYVTGRTEGGLDGNTSSGDSSDIFLVKYDSSGTKQWTKQLGTNSYDHGHGVTVDSSDNIYVTGYTEAGLAGNSNSGEQDVFLVKYNSNYLSGILFGNNNFVGVGSTGKIVRSEDNGSTFDNVTSSTTNDLYGVVFGNNTFVAVGDNGTIVKSTDNGSSFSSVTSPTINYLSGVVFENDTFVAVGNSGNIVRSTDNGTTWDNVTSPITSGLRGIATLSKNCTVAGQTFTYSLGKCSGTIQMGGAIQGTALSLSTAVTTLAGSSEGSTDATGTSARFYRPSGITTDGTNLYVADRYNHRIRKIVIDNGTVTTLEGSSEGPTDATGTSASFSNPVGITTDGTNLYVADYSNHRIRKIVISTGVVTTLAGSSSGNTDATGTSASFYWPTGITTDGSNLYVADMYYHRIRKIE